MTDSISSYGRRVQTEASRRDALDKAAAKATPAVKTAWVGFPPRSEETRLLTFPCFSGETKRAPDFPDCLASECGFDLGLDLLDRTSLAESQLRCLRLVD